MKYIIRSPIRIIQTTFWVNVCLSKHSYDFKTKLVKSGISRVKKILETCNVITKEAPKQVFFCEFFEFFQNTFLQNTCGSCFCQKKIAIGKFTSSFKQTNTNIHRQEHTTCNTVRNIYIVNNITLSLIEYFLKKWKSLRKSDISITHLQC